VKSKGQLSPCTPSLDPLPFPIPFPQGYGYPLDTLWIPFAFVGFALAIRFKIAQVALLGSIPLGGLGERSEDEDEDEDEGVGICLPAWLPFAWGFGWILVKQTRVPACIASKSAGVHGADSRDGRKAVRFSIDRASFCRMESFSLAIHIFWGL
jgi:hypothetical protein